MKATLLLSDKSRWEGEAFGAPGVAIGHIACHTGSYMEIAADPAYSNQLVLLSTPLAGVCGINTEACETGRPWLSGLIVREVCDTPTHWRSAETLDYYLRRHYITAIKNVDTNALLAHVANKGPFRAAICATPDFSGWNALHAKLNGHTMRGAYPGAVKHAVTYQPLGATRFRVGIVDLGSAMMLTKTLCRNGCEVTLLPPLGDWSAQEYDALVLSHGAREDGHPTALCAKVAECMDNSHPLLAVGNGFSLLCDALALPLTTVGLGMHGDNLLCRDAQTSRLFSSTHNHRLSLATQALAARDDLLATHTTADSTQCIGLHANGKPLWAMQFTHPLPLLPHWLAAINPKGVTPLAIPTP